MLFQDRLTPKQALAWGALAMVIDLFLGSGRWKETLDGALLNPDSYMRLVRLDDMLVAPAGQPVADPGVTLRTLAG
jgi:hypothetical protein